MSTPARTVKPLRLALLTLLLPLYLAVAFSTNYIGALNAPKPHHVKVAIVGAPSATEQLAHKLSVTPPNAYVVSQLDSTTQARQLVGQRKLAGAYLPSSQRPTLIVTTAAWPTLASSLEATFRQVAAEQEDRPLALDDVRPMPADNPSGSANFFFFLIICTLGAYMSVVALATAAPELPEYQRLAVVAAAAVLSPVVAYLIGGPGYGAFSGSFGTIIAMLAAGALYAFAVGAISRLMQLGLGAAVGGLLGPLLLIFVNFPSSGGSVAPQLLPGFWRFLNHFWIGAAGLDANRNILYFSGADVGTDVLKVLAWIAAWAALLAVPIYTRHKRRRKDAAAAGVA